MSNIAKIKKYDIANGKGIRTSIFFSGCTHACKGCFNDELWDFNVGESFTLEFYKTKIKPTINEHITGISLLGGEPLHPNNISATADLILLFKSDFQNKDIWLWTGFTWEELMSLINGNDKEYAQKLNAILCNINVLIDGKFIEEQKDITLRWRGSSNQRVIDVQETIKRRKVILYEDV